MISLDWLMPVIAPALKRVMKYSMAARNAHFKALPVVTGRVVFFGDSITEGGYWNEWFPECQTLNRGIGGNTVGDLLGRVELAIQSPRLVSLMIGTNDLSGLGRSRDPAEIAAQTRELVARIRALAPTAKLLINSVTPRTAFFAARIRELNQHYRQIAAEAGAEYIDLWPAMAEADGSIRKTLTIENLHLSGEGYRVWADVLRPHIVD